MAQCGSFRALARRAAALAVAVCALSLGAPGDGQAAGKVPEVEPQEWSFAGPFGMYDRAQLQRGFQVFSEVCAACHGMDLLSYRNLGQPGGPEFSEEAVKAIAAGVEVQDGPNDDGEMFGRPGRPSDRFVSPYANEQEARGANGGALPPDLSVIAKARTTKRDIPWFLEPLYWGVDIATGNEEKGADYLYALLVGYKEPPAGVEMAENMHYNAAFPGHQIAMAQPLDDDIVEYTDGTPATLDNLARDVTAYMMWAAEPKLEERRELGFRVMIYLILLTGILYLAKRRVWSRMKH